jgi:hypothetical protein
MGMVMGVGSGGRGRDGTPHRGICRCSPGLGSRPLLVLAALGKDG